MQSVLITGGAGFIGQNLVHAWRRAQPADRVVVIDAMTYAANIRSLEPLVADRSIVFVKGDIRDADLMCCLFEERALSIWQPSPTSTDPSPIPRPFCRPTCSERSLC